MSIKTRSTRALTALTVFIALGQLACTSSSPTQTNSSPAPTSSAPTQPTAQVAEQHIASIQKARTQELEYLTGLEKAIREEKRNEAWASEKESELRKSFSAQKDLRKGLLKSVDCRSAKCDLQFQVSLEPKELTEQHAAINYWVATQPCAYTMTTWPNPEQASDAVRVFLNCSEQ